MPNDTSHTPETLLSALTLEQGAAIAALPEPARTSVLASLQLRASDTAPVMDEGTFGEDQAAELYLAARAAMLGVDPLEVLRGDPFDRSNMASHSTQFDRLMGGYSYQRFCAEHPADQQLEFSGNPSAFVGLVQGGPGTSSWHAHGDTARAVQALAEDHADEGLELVTIWDLRTGKRAVTDFVVALTVHVQAYSADDAYEHVVERLDDLDSEIPSSDEDAVPSVHHLHAAGPFYGPARADAENVESYPYVWRHHDIAEALTATSPAIVAATTRIPAPPSRRLTRGELAVIADGLDSHLYWQVCQDETRKNGGNVLKPHTAAEQKVVDLIVKVDALAQTT